MGVMKKLKYNVQEFLKPKQDEKFTCMHCDKVFKTVYGAGNCCIKNFTNEGVLGLLEVHYGQDRVRKFLIEFLHYTYKMRYENN